MLQVEGGEIHYEEHGSGKPVLLFAPGFLGSRIERWQCNPARPGVEQDWLDPIAALSDGFRLIALDVRNAGRSKVALGDGDGWHSYTQDHLALLDRLDISRCHVMGACIGVSFALALAQARPALVRSLVLQNPIGASADNREALDGEFRAWAGAMEGRPDATPERLRQLQQAMFGNDFIFSVSREFVQALPVPILLMPGNDVVHAREASDDLARAPNVEVLEPWKGPGHKVRAMQRVRGFFLEQGIHNER
jgi:pimeloyl-ACP methyl ester carboxylesterase